MPRSASPKDIITTINRVKDTIALQHANASKPNRTINLGLERISKAIPPAPGWKGIHVGGTNGKGSIIAYLSALFKLAGISHATYTSPSFPERYNSVSINGLYCNKRVFETERARTPKLPKRPAYWEFTPPEDEDAWYHQLTPFEKDTAAAFRVFDRMKVKYGIVEVGMGGATDATNAMVQKSLTIVGKIGLDHQEYLGNTVEEIAKVKAGIMRIGVPCVVDATNSEAVLQVLQEHARQVRTNIILTSTPAADKVIRGIDRAAYPLEPYQETNLRCAILGFKELFPDKPIDINALLRLDPKLPGRTEWINAQTVTGDHHSGRILVDGAHNMLGIEALVGYVDQNIRARPSGADNSQRGPVTWIMSQSSSSSKPFVEMIQTLVRPEDNFAFVEYTPGENEPNSASAKLAIDVARTCVDDDAQVYNGSTEISEAIRWAATKTPSSPIIITGSLYLIRELYALPGIERERNKGEMKPGRSQIWRLTRAAQQRELTDDEEKEYSLARQHWYYRTIRNPLFKELHSKNETDLSEQEDAEAAEDMEKRERLKDSLHYELALVREHIVLEKHGLRDPEMHVEFDETFPYDFEDDRPKELQYRASGLTHEQVLYKRKLFELSLQELYEEQAKVLAEWDHHRDEYNRNAFVTRSLGNKWLTYEEVFGISPVWPKDIGVANSFEHQVNPMADIDSFMDAAYAERRDDLKVGRDPEAWVEDWQEPLDLEPMDWEENENGLDDSLEERAFRSRPRSPPKMPLLKRKRTGRGNANKIQFEEWGYDGEPSHHPVVSQIQTRRRRNVKDEVAERRRDIQQKDGWLIGAEEGDEEFAGREKADRWVNPNPALQGPASGENEGHGSKEKP